ncbi:hypothetical protein Vafri_6320, partial [Volvox africanus]
RLLAAAVTAPPPLLLQLLRRRVSPLTDGSSADGSGRTTGGSAAAPLLSSRCSGGFDDVSNAWGFPTASTACSTASRMSSSFTRRLARLSKLLLTTLSRAFINLPSWGVTSVTSVTSALSRCRRIRTNPLWRGTWLKNHIRRPNIRPTCTDTPILPSAIFLALPLPFISLNKLGKVVKMLMHSCICLYMSVYVCVVLFGADGAVWVRMGELYTLHN